MAIGYLIGINKMPLKQALKKVIKNEMEIIPHFMKQLEVYDLEKMAFVSIQREWSSAILYCASNFFSFYFGKIK